MKNIFFSTLFISSALYSEIIQTNRIETILPHIDDVTWILFDIDNTLLESAIQAGRTEWFDQEVKQLMAIQGLDRREAEEILYPAWDYFMRICPIQTPEQNTAEIVKEAQQKSNASLALTARHPSLSKHTLHQLENLKINFFHYAPQPVTLDTPHPTYWEQGVLFASAMNSKGTIFKQFIEKSNKKPEKIVFIDDSKHHLELMERELKEIGIKFIGFHYTKSFERYFDPELALGEYQKILKEHQETHRS